MFDSIMSQLFSGKDIQKKEDLDDGNKNIEFL